MFPYGLFLGSYLQDPLLSSCPDFPSWESKAARRNKPSSPGYFWPGFYQSNRKVNYNSISPAVYTVELKIWCTTIYMFIFIKTRESGIDNSPNW